MSSIDISTYIQEFKNRVAKHPRMDFTTLDIQSLYKYLELDKIQPGQKIDLWKMLTTCMMFGYVRGVRSENRRMRKEQARRTESRNKAGNE